MRPSTHARSAGSDTVSVRPRSSTRERIASTAWSNDLQQSDALSVRLETTLRGLGVVEEVFDQPIDLLRLPPHDGQRSLGRAAVEPDTDDRVPDRRQRFSQLVIEHRQELVLGATRRVGIGTRALGDREPLLPLRLVPLLLGHVAGAPDGAGDSHVAPGPDEPHHDLDRVHLAPHVFGEPGSLTVSAVDHPRILGLRALEPGYRAVPPGEVSRAFVDPSPRISGRAGREYHSRKANIPENRDGSVG
jgi:hypothetical protein